MKSPTWLVGSFFLSFAFSPFVNLATFNEHRTTFGAYIVRRDTLIHQRMRSIQDEATLMQKLNSDNHQPRARENRLSWCFSIFFPRHPQGDTRVAAALGALRAYKRAAAFRNDGQYPTGGFRHRHHSRFPHRRRRSGRSLSRRYSRSSAAHHMYLEVAHPSTPARKGNRSTRPRC
ncbi:hypothetical protein BKA67DRAFT_680863 [Truncatella angustata]|uniref:Secreted protein n=1 Tax=Truncatella angustata TaxID=152316 RepID=A0A9P8UHH9_9PEZI|nr:uncharacterized protein BKA67DRAFT_680863 [Truncatella angustata]KAH6652314.1 hypothetical protein BKA67DRAFT_680863 [Truncatella angustata]